jgi:Tfp pilus assembly protein FimT
MLLSTGHLRPIRARRRRAYSLLEMIVVLLIIQMIAAFAMFSVATVANSGHLDLIRKRCIGAARYARMLAMSTGQPCNVDFNLTNGTIYVSLGASTTPVSNSLFAGGRCLMNLATDQGVAGTTITAVTNSATAPVPGSTVYRCTYGKLGTRTNAPDYTAPMTVTFTYGQSTTTLTIPNAGDPD